MPEGEGGGGRDDPQDLDWKDYLAIVIALLQTVVLPVLLLIVMIIAAVVLLKLAL
jgi:hypothetical protein